MATSDLLPTALVTTGTAPAALPQTAPSPAPVERDRFARRAGPDVTFKGPEGLTEAYAVFSVDPVSKQLQVMVVDAEGRVLRSIPPSSVARMMESMGRYRPG
jgi:hypothetical protein